MKSRLLFTLLLTIALAVPTAIYQHRHKPTVPTAVVKTAVEHQHSTTFRLGVYVLFQGNPKEDHGESGHCSGTSVGPHAILTAQHCFKNSNLIRIGNDTQPTHILAALIDGHDHVIYLVDRDFLTWSAIDQRTLIVGETVHQWGAPGDSNDVYRTGYFNKLAPLADADKNFLLQNFVLPVYHGDSGSGIFDANGSVIAVVSMGDESADEYSLPLQFTDTQLDIATSE